jgi:hypothetical protein
MYLQKNPGINITKYEIAELTRRPYLRALSSENLMSAFRATGIYPFDKTVLTTAQMAPSVIYIDIYDLVLHVFRRVRITDLGGNFRNVF